MSFKVNGKWDVSKISMVPTTKDYQWAALQARNTIRKRTLNGVDINGDRFQPYSAQTIMYREKMGKTTDIVNLEDTNAMLGSLTYDANEYGATVGMSNAHAAEYGLKHQTGSGVPKREWFGLPESEAVRLSQEVSKRVIQRNQKGTK